MISLAIPKTAVPFSTTIMGSAMNGGQDNSVGTEVLIGEPGNKEKFNVDYFTKAVDIPGKRIRIINPSPITPTKGNAPRNT